MDNLWIFGYGSLMWRPDFRFEEVVRARVSGFRRCFCLYSVHHRGTEARPGLVLGLDKGGTCEGLAFRVATSDVEETLEKLRAREQVNGVYREAHITVEIVGPVDGSAFRASAHQPSQSTRSVEHGDRVVALTYLVERAHPSYAGALPLKEQARYIRGARGRSGNNMEYVANTLEHLRALKIRERELERLAALLGSRVSRGGEDLKDECPRLHGIYREAARTPVRHRRLKPAERRRFNHRKLMS